MNWQQKFAAIKSLSPASLEMMSPGDWLVSQPDLGIQQGPCLVSFHRGRGGTPEEAVNAAWEMLTTIPDAHAVAVSPLDDPRFYRWNGFMWQEVAAP